MPRESANIPYTMTVLRTFGDRSVETMKVPGVWKGAIYSRSKVTCRESGPSAPDTETKQPVTPKNSSELPAPAANGQTLDESEAGSLVEGLKEKLPDLDDATVEAITQKWDAHEDLAGKTKPQILRILFNECQAVVKDKETQNAIWTALNEPEKSTSN